MKQKLRDVVFQGFIKVEENSRKDDVKLSRTLSSHHTHENLVIENEGKTYMLTTSDEEEVKELKRILETNVINL